VYAVQDLISVGGAPPRCSLLCDVVIARAMLAISRPRPLLGLAKAGYDSEQHLDNVLAGHGVLVGGVAF